MLVNKGDITKIDMIDNEHNDFCVRFHLGKDGKDGQIILPCFFVAGFPIDEYPELKAEQLRLTQEYLDQYPDDAYVQLNADILYNMDVYH